MTRRFSQANLPWVLLALTALALGYLLGTTQSSVFAAPAKEQVKQVKSSQLPEVSVGPPAREAYTLYMSRSGTEKERAAEHMTQLHQVMAARGYVFASLERHEENNDLKGWWITYLPGR